MKTLLDLFESMDRLGNREAILTTNGYRTRRRTYREICAGARSVVDRLQQAGAAKGDHVVLWAENSPEWVEVFWGSVLHGVAVVPIDFRSSPDFVRRVVDETSPLLCFHGDETDPEVLPPGKCLSLSEPLRAPAQTASVEVTPEDIVEILYTSGSMAAPKGVVHRHKNICANLSPLADEIARYALTQRRSSPSAHSTCYRSATCSGRHSDSTYHRCSKDPQPSSPISTPPSSGRPCIASVSPSSPPYPESWIAYAVSPRRSSTAQ